MFIRPVHNIEQFEFIILFNQKLVYTGNLPNKSTVFKSEAINLFKDTRSVSLYAYNQSQILQYVKYTK